ncbi:hypothetical protein BZL30_9439, partial [Mycobacterium kansasii]
MFMAMLEGMKEESVGFLFNVTVEAGPAPQVEVAPVEEPEDLAEFATARRPPPSSVAVAQRCPRRLQVSC